MSSRLRFVIGLAALLSLGATALLAQSKGRKSMVKEGAYYEFRGHIYDRSTIERNFTLYWSEGSQPIFVNRSTKIFRNGKPAALQEVKSGDSVRGVGQVVQGRLTALAVAFGNDAVELPRGLNLPQSITMPPQNGSR